MKLSRTEKQSRVREQAQAPATSTVATTAATAATTVGPPLSMVALTTGTATALPSSRGPSAGATSVIAVRCAGEAPATLVALQREAWDGLAAHMIGGAHVPYDRVRCDGVHALAVTNANTSPTNIGLYLATLVTQSERGALTHEQARAEATASLTTLAHLDKDARGFLYNWYDADTGAITPGERFVSSVDNGNLVVALDGVRHAFADDEKICALIDSIATPMKAHFADAFLDASLEHGVLNLGYVVHDDGERTLTPNRYDRFGSEARACVALLEAERFLPAGTLARMGEKREMASVHIDDASRVGRDVRVLKTWDGGVFQWLLPQLLLGETEISPVMKRSHDALVAALVALGRYGLPAARSACDVPSADGGAHYQGKSGVAALAEDAEFVDERVLTPHAIFLLASVDKSVANAALARLLAVAPQLARPGVGLCDGVDLDSGAVTNTLLSLNQTMSVLAGGGFDAHVRARVTELAGVEALASVFARALR